MKNFKSIVLLVSILGVAACGDNLDSLRPDAREQGDGPPMIDSPPGTPDANLTPDATVSSVVNTPDCTGIAAGDITVHMRAPSMNGFQLMGGSPDNPPLVLTIGDIVEFQTNNVHNFAAGPLVTAPNDFTSAPPGAHRACLTFTAAFVGDYQCDLHPTTMNGTLTVAP